MESNISFSSIQTIGTTKADKVITSGNLLMVSSGGTVSVYKGGINDNYTLLWQKTINPLLPQSYTDIALGHGCVFICTGQNNKNTAQGKSLQPQGGGGGLIPQGGGTLQPQGGGSLQPQGGGLLPQNGNLPNDLQPLSSLALIVLDLSTGNQRTDWDYISNIELDNKGTYILPSNVIASNNQLVFSDQLGTVYGLDFTTKKLYWFTPSTNSKSPQGQIVLGRDAAFFINYQDNNLYAMNFASQVLRWEYPQPQSRNFSYKKPVVSDKAIFISLLDGSVQALDINSNKNGATTILYDTLSDPSMPTGQTWNLPAIDDKNDIAVFTSQQYIVVLKLSTGKVLGQVNFPATWVQNNKFCSPLIYRDHIAALELIQNEKEFTIFIPTVSGTLFAASLTENIKNPNSPVYSIIPFSESITLNSVTQVVEQDISLGTGTIVIPTTSGVASVSFGSNTVCAFQNNTSVNLPIQNATNIGNGNFSIEAWVLNVEGGTILSQETDGTKVGFQLEICNKEDANFKVMPGEGRIRFIITDGINLQAAQSIKTNICDGHWHHIAVVRNTKGFVIFLDGKNISCDTWHSKETTFEQPLSLNGTNPWYVGSSTQSSIVNQNSCYIGLMSELRIWNKALTASQIQDRLGWMLTGTENGLIALLQVQTQSGNNSLIERKSGATLNTPNLNFLLSDLNLNDNLFPFLVHNHATEWPYSETWVLEGENNVTSAASGTGEVIGFGSGNVFYAINEVKGNRLWEWRADSADSNYSLSAVCDKNNFYLPEFNTNNAGNYYIHALNAKNGQLIWDWNISLNAGAAAIPPISVAGQVIVCPDGQNIYGINKKDGTNLWTIAAGKNILGQLLVNKLQVIFVSGNTLYSYPINQSGALNTSTKGKLSFALNTAPTSILMACDGGKLFVYDGKNIYTFDATTLQPIANSVWNPDLSSLGSATITSMSASNQYNRLYLTSSSGALLSLDFSSGKQVFINQPLTTGNTFCSNPENGVLYCTSSNGIIAYDARTGNLIGQYNSNTQPVTRPYVKNSTVVFPCNDKRLHSVVFGSDFALNIAPSQTAITLADNGKIAVTDPTQFSFETWYNSQTGGQLFAMNNSAGANVGFSLSLNPGGEVQANITSAGYSCTAKATSALVLDGNWHHISVVVKKGVAPSSQTLMLLFLDGKRMEGLKNISLDSTIKLPAKGSILIGGNGTSSPYIGMLKELRLWNETLLEVEIQNRMHLKLRGSEPNLLACWDMGAKSIFDCSPNQISDNSISGLSFWLCSLHLIKPLYPYLVANTVAQQVTTSNTNTGTLITNATYISTIVIRNFDGSPRKDAKVGMWANVATNVNITNFSNPNNDPTAQASATIDSANGITGYTDINGQVILELTCSNTLYSPELTVWADYMYPNERIHVSAVPESQKHITIPPPHLSSNVKIITDYNYAQGDGSSKFKKTETAITQVVLNVSDHNNVQKPGEVLEVWASDTLLVTYNNKEYTLTAQSGERFVTDLHGEVVLSISKTNSKINSPKLIVHGLFQPRTDTFVVDPAADAHKKLNAISGQQLKGTTPIDPTDTSNNSFQGLDSNKKPIFKNKKSTFLSPSQQNSAHDLAHSITTLSTAAHGGASSVAPAADAGIGFFNAPYPTGVQNPDSAPALPRKMGAFSSRAACLSSMPNQNFVISINRNSSGNITGVTHSTDPTTYNSAYQAVQNTLAKQNNRMGSWDSFWHSVGHGIVHIASDVAHDTEAVVDDAANLAEKGINGAAQLVADGFNDVGLHQIGSLVVTTVQDIENAAGEVIHHIAVAITTIAGDVLNFIIKTVEDVAHAIEQVFLAIEKAIEEVIAFLKALFDWEEILRIHDNLSAVVTQQLNDFSSQFSGFTNDFSELFGNFNFASLAKGSPSGSLTTGANLQSQYINHAKASHSSSKNRWINHKSQPQQIRSNSPTNTNQSSNVTTSSLALPSDNIGAQFNGIESQLIALLENPGDIFHMDLQKILPLFEGLLTNPVGEVVSMIPKLIEFIENGVQNVQNEISAPIDIFFISDFYEFLTGNTLTLLDLICLVLAVPVHIVFVFSGETYVPLSIMQTSFSSSNAGSNIQMGDGKSPGTTTSLIMFSLFTVVNGCTQALNALADWEQMEYQLFSGFKKFTGLLSSVTAIVKGATLGAVDKLLLGQVFDKFAGMPFGLTYIFVPVVQFIKSIYDYKQTTNSSFADLRFGLSYVVSFIGLVSIFLHLGEFLYRDNKENSGGEVVPMLPFTLNISARWVNDITVLTSFLASDTKKFNFGGVGIPTKLKVYCGILIGCGVAETGVQIAAYTEL